MNKTIINTSAQPGSNNESTAGIIIGLMLLFITGFLFFYYLLPFMARIASNFGGSQINIPDKVDVNIHMNPKY